MLNVYFVFMLIVSTLCFIGGAYAFGVAWLLIGLHGKFVTNWSAW